LIIFGVILLTISIIAKINIAWTIAIVVLLAGAILALGDAAIAASLDRWRAAQTEAVAAVPTADPQR